jgi:hypothetical protein
VTTCEEGAGKAVAVERVAATSGSRRSAIARKEVEVRVVESFAEVRDDHKLPGINGDDVRRTILEEGWFQLVLSTAPSSP